MILKVTEKGFTQFYPTTPELEGEAGAPSGVKGTGWPIATMPRHSNSDPNTRPGQGYSQENSLSLLERMPKAPPPLLP